MFLMLRYSSLSQLVVETSIYAIVPQEQKYEKAGVRRAERLFRFPEVYVTRDFKERVRCGGCGFGVLKSRDTPHSPLKSIHCIKF